MSRKTHRIEVIRSVIESEKISSQEELMVQLHRLGIDVTQSTLSRDIKELNAVKVPTRDKGYVYMIPEAIDQQPEVEAPTVLENIHNIDFSGNIVVLRTKNEYAKAVGSLLDMENFEDVLGSVSGDDTIFMLLREGVNPVKFIEESLDHFYPGLRNLYKPADKKKLSFSPRKRLFK